MDALAYTAIWALPIFGLGVIFNHLGALRLGSLLGLGLGDRLADHLAAVRGLPARHATPGMRGKPAAWINVVAATMVFNLFFINIVVSGLPPTRAGRPD